MNPTRRIRITLTAKEDEENPWDDAGIRRWIKENLDEDAAKEWIVRIDSVEFPDGRYGELSDDDIVSD